METARSDSAAKQYWKVGPLKRLPKKTVGEAKKVEAIEIAVVETAAGVEEDSQILDIFKDGRFYCRLFL